MSRFYENLLDHHLPRDEALREAQQFLRHLSVDELPRQWAKLRPQPDESSPALDEAAMLRYLDRPLTHRPFEHPAYWGAFVLLGRSTPLDPEKRDDV